MVNCRFTTWRVRFNLDRKVDHVHHKGDVHLDMHDIQIPDKMLGVTLEETSRSRYLGINIQNVLRWNKQVEYAKIQGFICYHNMYNCISPRWSSQYENNCNIKKPVCRVRYGHSVYNYTKMRHSLSWTLQGQDVGTRSTVCLFGLLAANCFFSSIYISVGYVFLLFFIKQLSIWYFGPTQIIGFIVMHYLRTITPRCNVCCWP